MSNEPNQILTGATIAGRSRRGTVLIYASLALVVFLGFASLAVDFGRVQTIKQDLQRAADATALGGLTAYVDTGYNVSAAYTAAYTIMAQNPVDAGSGVQPTISAIPGGWDLATRTFWPNNFTVGPPAVRVVLSRTAATGNAIPLTFGKAVGINTVDASATAIAVLIEADSAPLTVPATANPYLGGLPPGSSSPWGDNMSNAAPCQAGGIVVVPGTWIEFTSTTGSSSILPGYIPSFGPNGEATRPLHHGQNQDGTDFNIGPENGIGDAIMPAGAFMGVFMSDASPTTNAPPAMIDWTDATLKNQPSYDQIPMQAPFLIGDGKTSTGTVKRFQVPPGATRLYLGVWDGVVQYNNAGQINTTINLKRNVRLVK